MDVTTQPYVRHATSPGYRAAPHQTSRTSQENMTMFVSLDHDCARSPRQNYLYSSAELTRPCFFETSFISNRATQQQIETSARGKLTYANLRGYDEPIRSADIRTEVNIIMTRFGWRIRTSVRSRCPARRRCDIASTGPSTRSPQAPAPLRLDNQCPDVPAKRLVKRLECLGNAVILRQPATPAVTEPSSFQTSRLIPISEHLPLFCSWLAP
jgi:hypothetical protein